QATHHNAGAVNVIYGSSGGLTNSSSAVPAPQLWTQSTGTIGGLLDFADENDAFGTALASGDFNGDGFSDLAIAVPGELTTVSGTTVSGAIHVLYGSSSGLVRTGNQFITSDQIGLSAIGNSLVWGDFDGNGFGDLAVEGPLATPTVAIVFGSATGLNHGV